MPRTISRSERMDESIVLRATRDDKSRIKLEAQKRGMDVSTFIRMVLIKENIINPLGVSNDGNNW